MLYIPQILVSVQMMNTKQDCCFMNIELHFTFLSVIIFFNRVSGFNFGCDFAKL